MQRREFVRDLAVLGAAVAATPAAAVAADDDITAKRIPRWRGFNLQGRFGWPGHPYEGPAYEESDFEAMAEWGFDFARLPLAYWTWGSRDDWSQIREEPLRHVDAAVELGKQYGVHVNVNFHRIPGYCINGRELEPHDLFSGKKADRQKALAAQIAAQKQQVAQPLAARPVAHHDHLVFSLVRGFYSQTGGTFVAAALCQIGQFFTPIPVIPGKTPNVQE